MRDNPDVLDAPDNQVNPDDLDTCAIQDNLDVLDNQDDPYALDIAV